MNFIEMITGISDRKEKVLLDKPLLIKTDKFSYVKDADGNWNQRELPEVFVEEKFPEIVSQPISFKQRKVKK